MKWLSKTYIWVIMAFLYAPIGVLIFFSFNQSKSRSNFTGFTLDWYVKLFHNDLIIQSLINTLIVALVSSIIATVIGTIAAVGINSMKNWKRSIIMNITYLPIVNPEIVIGVSFMPLFLRSWHRSSGSFAAVANRQRENRTEVAMRQEPSSPLETSGRV